MKMNLSFSSRVPITFVAAILGVVVLGASVNAAPQWLQGGHAARITGVALSPDGTMIASASEDGTVKLWSTNGTLLRTLDTQPYLTTAVAWSPDGTKIAAGTYYGGWTSGLPGLGLTYVWQATSGWTNSVNLVNVTTNQYGKVGALAFSADSSQLASGCAAGSNLVCSVPGGSVVASCPAFNTSVGPAAVTGVAFSSRGLMASGCEDATVCVYGSGLSSRLWYSTTAHSSNVTAVAFSPNGALLTTASLDQTVKIWSTNGWTRQQTLTGDTSGFASVAFSPDGQKIVAGCLDGTVQIWNWSSGVCQATIAVDALPVTKTAFSADGSLVISGSDDGVVRLWSVANGSPVCTLGSQSYFIGAIAVSPDGTLCASAGGSGAIQVRKTSNGALVQTLAANTNYVSSLAFSPDSARLASGGGPLDPTIKIWQLNDGALLATIPATTNGVMALAWSPDGSTLASGGDSAEQNITFWGTNGVLYGTLPGALSGHTNGVTALAFSPQGNLLASGGRRPGNMVQIWTNNIPGIWTTGMVVQSFTSTSTSNNVQCVAFSPNGQLVAWGRDAQNVLKIGSVTNGTNPTLGSGTNPVFAVAFSPDGSTLAATYQNTIQFWTNGSSWSSWALCLTVTNETVRASCLAYSPNGNLFLCGREDGTVTQSASPRGALGQPPLKFTSFTVGAHGATTIGASVQPWTHYVIQSSTNLNNWSFLTPAVSGSNTLTMAGPFISNAGANFFRATTPP